MKTEIDEREYHVGPAANRIAAAIDVERNSDRYMQTYTAKETEGAWDAYAQIIAAYRYGKAYVTFRKDFIAIKVTKPRVTPDVQIMDAQFAEKGYSKVITPQGIVYHIPKKAVKS